MADRPSVNPVGVLDPAKPGVAARVIGPPPAPAAAHVAHPAFRVVADLHRHRLPLGPDCLPLVDAATLPRPPVGAVVAAHPVPAAHTALTSPVAELADTRHRVRRDVDGAVRHVGLWLVADPAARP